MTEVELRLFRYFTVLAEELHFGRAAERIGIAQPPLSQQIQRLEHKLGVQLFRRTKRKVELTEPGRMFLEHARSTLALAEQAVNVARLAGRGELGRLAIGVVSSATYENVIPRALGIFRERFPRVDLVLREASTPDQIRLLHSGEIQIGFIRPPFQDSAIELRTVTREPLIAALPSRHRLARRTAITLADLKADPWVMISRDLGLGFADLVLRTCLSAGFTPPVTQEATQIHTLIGMVAAGLGVTLVPAPVRSLQRPGVVYVPLKGKHPPAEVAAAFLRDGRTPVLQAFLRILSEEARPATWKRQPPQV
jgi:DNA-binding transcriptional LysR family regulator